MGLRSLFLNILLSPAVLQGFFSGCLAPFYYPSQAEAEPLSNKEPRTCYNVCCSLLAYPQYDSASISLISPWTSLLASKLLEGLAWVVSLDLPCQVVADLPLPLVPLLQLLWGAPAFEKLCRKLCTIEAHFGCRDSLCLKASWLISKMCSSFMSCSSFGLRSIVRFSCVWKS